MSLMAFRLLLVAYQGNTDFAICRFFVEGRGRAKVFKMLAFYTLTAVFQC